jgi:uncharacterized protein with von Willebrand factor type A (vWA) domain
MSARDEMFARAVSRLVASLLLVSCSSSPVPAPAPPPAEPVSVPTAAAASAAIPPPPPEPTVAESTRIDPPKADAPPPLAADPGCKRDAIVLVLDRSGSMTGEPIEASKRAAKRVTAKLDKDDCFGLVVFDSQPTRTVKLARLADRAAVDKTIDTITAGGGTEIFSALDYAYQDLSTAKSARRRAVVLVTDGQAPQNGIQKLVESMAAEDMRVSTIGLGGGIDEALLRMIADKTKGRMLKVISTGDLVKNVEAEVTRLRM